MKVLMKPVDMIALFTKEGIPKPIRYQITGEENGNLTIRVDRVLVREEEKLAGNRMLIYKCQSNIEGMERLYELKFEVGTMRWFLYKM